MKKIFFLSALVLLTIIIVSNSKGPSSPVSDKEGSSLQEKGTKFKTEVIAQNLDVPWELVFTPDGRMFFTERPGYVRVIENGKVKEEPLVRIEVADTGEAGLLGLALHPDFETNHNLYIYYSYQDGGIKNRVVMLVENDGKLKEEKVILNNIPGGGNHDGGRLKFGPDGKLYITTGDAGNGNLAQSKDSLAGKILRLNPDGSVPSDNPFSGSPVYSFGHRNPQGFAFHPMTNQLFAMEHGPSAHDEVNFIEKGRNYGWPNTKGIVESSGFENPIIESGNDTWAPSGAVYYSGDKFTKWKNNIFFAGLRGNGIWRLEITGDNKAGNLEKIIDARFGRIRNIVQGPDGHLYFMTNNRDGRGNPDQTDDKIIRLVPDES